MQGFSDHKAMAGRGRGRGRSRRSDDRNIPGRNKALPSKYLWVGHLPEDVSEGVLIDLFSRFGELERICLQAGRNFAFVDFKKEESAFAAMKSLHGYVLAGSPIIVEFTKDSKFPNQPVIEQPYKPDHRTNEELPPSESLWVGYPPSIDVSETILRNIFSPFGPIRKITTFSDRSYSFVTFENISSSIRAKQALEGKLFGNPRAQIRFAKNESGPSDPARYQKTMLPSQPFESRNSRNLPHFSEEIQGVKRMRTGSLVPDDELPEFTPTVPMRRLKEWEWEGVIAKGGNHVCRARCLPVGRPMEMMLPAVVDCTARTSTEMLAKHFLETPNSWVVFFVPNTDADIESYDDFMNYLGSKQRVAVAKLNEDHTLFLTAPSEFSEKVLKVPGRLSISGVVLKLEPQSHNPPRAVEERNYHNYSSQNVNISEVPRGSVAVPNTTTLQPDQIALLAQSVLGKRAAGPPDNMYYAPQNPVIAEKPQSLNMAVPSLQAEQLAQLVSRFPLQSNQVGPGGFASSLPVSQQQVFSGPQGPVSGSGQSEESDPGRRLQATLQLAATLLQNVKQNRGT